MNSEELIVLQAIANQATILVMIALSVSMSIVLLFFRFRPKKQQSGGSGNQNQGNQQQNNLGTGQQPTPNQNAQPANGRRFWVFISDNLMKWGRNILILAVALVILIWGWQTKVWGLFGSSVDTTQPPDDTTPADPPVAPEGPPLHEIILDFWNHWYPVVLIALGLFLILKGITLLKDKKGGRLILLGFVLLALATSEGRNFVQKGVEWAWGLISSTKTITAPVGAWSEPIRVTKDRCIFFWGEDPDGDAFTTVVRMINDPTWWHFGDVLEADDTPSFAWIKFQSNEARPATISYEFRKRGECF